MGVESNNELITVRSHLTENIRPGDILLGYDMRSVGLTGDLEEIVDSAASIPDVILVKKKYRRGRRIWKLKHLDKENEPATRVNKKEEESNANQYEEFLKDIEEDKPLRSQLNLYKDEKAIKDLEGRFKNMKVDEIQRQENDPEIDVQVGELLDELTLDENKIVQSAIPLVDMKLYTKTDRKGKVLVIDKNNPSKNLNEETLDKSEKVKRTRTGDMVDENVEKK
jgi:nonsense-mediated mRNA decay protein 3